LVYKTELLVWDAIEFLFITTDTRPKELMLYLFLKYTKALDLYSLLFILKNVRSFIEPIREGAL